MYFRSRRSKLPDLTAIMLAGGTSHLIQNEQAPGIQQDRASMRNAIIAAGCFGPSSAEGSLEGDQINLRLAAPAKRSGGLRLVLPVNRNRIVRGRAAKPVARSRVGYIGIRAGIDKNGLTIKPDQHIQRIGMTVAGSRPAEGSRIELREQLFRLQKQHAAVIEDTRASGRRLCTAGCCETLGAQPPGRLLGDRLF